MPHIQSSMSTALSSWPARQHALPVLSWLFALSEGLCWKHVYRKLKETADFRVLLEESGKDLRPFSCGLLTLSGDTASSYLYDHLFSVSLSLCLSVYLCLSVCLSFLTFCLSLNFDFPPTYLGHGYKAIVLTALTGNNTTVTMPDTHVSFSDYFLL